MQIPVSEIKTALTSAQGMIKLGLEFVPGATSDEKTATVLAAIEPIVKRELEEVGASPMVQDLALRVLAWIVSAEVKAVVAA